MVNETLDLDESSEASQKEAREMLLALCKNGFDGSVGETALALGRNGGFLEQVLDGRQEVDDDLIIKIRGIALVRNIAIE
jgi:hypothetical protein